MKPLFWIAVDPDSGARLCNDLKWRRHAHIGTTSTCVKKWRREHYAQRAAIRHRRCKPPNLAHLIALYDGDSLDASGVIRRKEGFKDDRHLH